MKKISMRVVSLTVVITIGLLVACKSKGLDNNLENEIKDTSKIDLIELSEYKNTDIKDSKTIEIILDKLLANIYVRKFNYENKYGDYILNIKYSLANDWDEKDKFKLMNYNSVVLFSLIKNLSTINYILEDFDNTVYQFNKNVYDKTYNVDLSELPNDLQKWKYVLEEVCQTK